MHKEYSSYLFNGMDSYDTPDGIPVSPWFKLMGKSRWYFYFDNFRTFMLSGKCARKGQLDKSNQILYSSRNIKLIERCGGKVHIRGLNHLRENGNRPVVVLANHMSLLETAMIHAVIGGYLDFSFVIKESLTRTPYMKDILKSFNSIAVTRTNPREDLKRVLSEGKRTLESGVSMVIFPQATRSETFDPSMFSSIGVKLARSANVPVMPLALKTDFVGNGKGKLKDIGPIHPEREVWFEFGAPMAITGNGQEQQQAVCDFIATRVAKWISAEGR